MPRGEIMNKIDEVSNEFEYSSGWKKMIRDTRNERINEELKAKIEDLQIKLEELNSSITDLAKKEIKEDKDYNENTDIKHIVMQNFYKFEASFALLEDEIKIIQSELINYRNLIENQNLLLNNIANILNSMGNVEASSQKGFLANIFKKK